MVCCSGVLHHLDIERAAKSWSKVLNDDGLVVMLEPMAYNPIIAVYRFFTPKMRTVDEQPLRPKDIKTLKKHFGEVIINGFVLTSLFSLVLTYLPFSVMARDKAFNFLEKIDTSLLKICPFLGYFCWSAVIVLKKPIEY
jgi:hypothetical protein